jgi:UDP-3-O-[3-hydroxymyristoyl] glucosamine N-acyltransferase
MAARLEGDADTPIRAVAPLDKAGPGDLSFLSNPRYRSQVAASGAAALVLKAADAQALLTDAAPRPALVLCEAPYAWFALAAQVLAPEAEVVAQRSPQAVVDPSAQIDPSARIDAFAVVEAGAQVGARTWVGPGCRLAAGSRIGADCRLVGNVSLMQDCRLGDRVLIHAGAVIGADGFGFAPFEGRWLKIPQTGRVLVGDDVEIGANTTIDRGTMGDTVVEHGVKIDNQVQIGHNCRIGAHTVIAGCVGIAGSAVIGRQCQIGGAAMIHGHISLCDGVVVSGGTLISRSIAQAGFYSGVFPFMTNRDWEKNAAVVRHLDELRTRLRRLEAGRRDAEGEEPGP